MNRSSTSEEQALKASISTHFSNSRGRVEVEEGENEAIKMAVDISKSMMDNFRAKAEDEINILTNPR